MRLWTVHPRYLDGKGLVALWREGLLAQQVLAGKTRGYTRHPQLTRFRSHRNPLGAIGAYLFDVADEAERRGYRFDRDRVIASPAVEQIPETREQLLYEWSHLQAKLGVRAADLCRAFRDVECPRAHPLFRIVRGRVREWKRTAPIPSARSPNRNLTALKPSSSQRAVSSRRWR